MAGKPRFDFESVAAPVDGDLMLPPLISPISEPSVIPIVQVVQPRRSAE